MREQAKLRARFFGKTRGGLVERHLILHAKRTQNGVHVLSDKAGALEHGAHDAHVAEVKMHAGNARNAKRFHS